MAPRLAVGLQRPAQTAPSLSHRLRLREKLRAPSTRTPCPQGHLGQVSCEENQSPPLQPAASDPHRRACRRRCGPPPAVSMDECAPLNSRSPGLGFLPTSLYSLTSTDSLTWVMISL